MRWRGGARCGRAMVEVDHPLVALARQLLPAGVAVAWADPAQHYPLLEGEEVTGVPARRAEFSAGRHAARACLAMLGRPVEGIAAQGDRSPLWPSGVVGSISHTTSECLAVVALDLRLGGIGIDLEKASDLPENLLNIIMIPDERQWLLAQDGRLRGGLAKRIFCAKEAVYKAQFRQSATLFGFDTIQIILGAGTAFTAHFIRDVPPFAAQDQIAGHIAQTSGHILATATLPRHR